MLLVSAKYIPGRLKTRSELKLVERMSEEDKILESSLPALGFLSTRKEHHDTATLGGIRLCL